MDSIAQFNWRLLCVVCAALLAAGCGDFGVRDGAPRASPAIPPDAVPRAEAPSRYGNPESYVVDGERYHVLKSGADYRAQGMASWYGTKFHGKRTSSGEPYDMHAMTAAHKTLPLPTYVEVTNLENGRKAVVKVNDRGPFHDERIIDLSYAAAKKLGVDANGTARVEVRSLGAPAPVMLAADTTQSAAKDVYLQLGAFSDRANAERLVSSLLDATTENIHINRIQNGGNALYRVRVGPFDSEDAARKLGQTLSPLNLDNGHLVVE